MPGAAALRAALHPGVSADAGEELVQAAGLAERREKAPALGCSHVETAGLEGAFHPLCYTGHSKGASERRAEMVFRSDAARRLRRAALPTLPRASQEAQGCGRGSQPGVQPSLVCPHILGQGPAYCPPLSPFLKPRGLLQGQPACGFAGCCACAGGLPAARPAHCPSALAWVPSPGTPQPQSGRGREQGWADEGEPETRAGALSPPFEA